MRRVLQELLEGKLTLEEAERRIKLFSLEELSPLATLDLNRDLRTGAPEAVFGEGKGAEEIVEIARRFLQRRGRCIITRLSEEKIAKLKEAFSGRARVEVYPAARLVVLKAPDFEAVRTGGRVAVLCAGSSDIPAAEEAEVVAREMGCDVLSFRDIGVAGIHRLLPALKSIIQEDVDVAVVAAGMEGALPSVVAGIVDIPVIGLPVSTGYGIHGRGETALFAMLQSCSPGIAVVNIDNGFGAGVVAALIANRAARFR
ncbi:MAG: nickel pincer cofactor biosynthesis protein LarB [Euryarchaeota archaeon]|nr:nickel pincer cofactor biosynthesis protein LarB [Euryarchaeota archaeon]